MDCGSRQLLLHCSTTGTPDRYIPVGEARNDGVIVMTKGG
jgi:hypothetical protein